MTALKRVPLHDLHIKLGAKMVAFAGYEMPVQYASGVLQEHKHTRESAGLFDVSHMGQLRLHGVGANAALERVTPGDFVDMPLYQQRYSLLTSESGGILDDLMITQASDHVFVVVNAACKAADIAHLRTHIGSQCEIEELPYHALLALQGPKAIDVMQRLCSSVDFKSWVFMTAREIKLGSATCFVTRSGYTGEDGFEISIHPDDALAVAELLLAQPEVAPIGLGARDSLRLEAGLCLYGHDMTAVNSPVDASLAWAVPKVRRADGARAGGFLGAERVLSDLADGVLQKRVGLIGERIPVREGAVLVDEHQRPIGRVTSGTISPVLSQSIAMGYVDMVHSKLGSQVFALVRDKHVPMTVSSMPFVANRYYRGE